VSLPQTNPVGSSSILTVLKWHLAKAERKTTSSVILSLFETTMQVTRCFLPSSPSRPPPTFRLGFPYSSPQTQWILPPMYYNLYLREQSGANFFPTHDRKQRNGLSPDPTNGSFGEIFWAVKKNTRGSSMRRTDMRETTQGRYKIRRRLTLEKLQCHHRHRCLLCCGGCERPLDQIKTLM
jgi:hypothetical protein